MNWRSMPKEISFARNSRRELAGLYRDVYKRQVFFFYKNKLKTPLQELKDASQMIADNELDFHVLFLLEISDVLRSSHNISGQP